MGDDDVPLASALDGAGAAVFVASEVNRGHFGKLLGEKGKLSDNLDYIAKIKKRYIFRLGALLFHNTTR